MATMPQEDDSESELEDSDIYGKQIDYANEWFQIIC